MYIAQAAFFTTVKLFCSLCLHAPLKQDPSYFTTFCFDFYTHQSTALNLATGIYSTLEVNIFRTLNAIYGFNVINTFNCQW